MAAPAGRSGTLADQPVMGRGFDDFLAYWLPQTMQNYGQMNQPSADPQMVATTMGGMNMMPTSPMAGMQQTPGYSMPVPPQPPGPGSGGRVVPTTSTTIQNTPLARGARELWRSPYPFMQQGLGLPFGYPMGPGV